MRIAAVLMAACVAAFSAETEADSAAEACLKQKGRLPSPWEARKRNADTKIKGECVYVIAESMKIGEPVYGAVSLSSWQPVEPRGCATVCISFPPKRAEMR